MLRGTIGKWRVLVHCLFEEVHLKFIGLQPRVEVLYQQHVWSKGLYQRRAIERREASLGDKAKFLLRRRRGI